MEIKKFLSTTATVCVVAIGLSTSAAAVTWSPTYKETIPILNDYQSTLIAKTTTGSAYNDVSAIGTGKLTSWVETSTGTNLTTKNTYSTTGRKTMAYTNASTAKEQMLRLNISTSTGTLHTVYTEGKWTPN